MISKSEAFYITKGGSGLETVNRYILANIEYDAYLIKGITASPLNDSVTILTLTYSSGDEEMIQEISPRENYILTTGISTGDFGLSLLFTSPITTTLVSGSVSIDGSGLPNSSMSLDGYCNGYTLYINSSQFAVTGSHSYLIDNTRFFRQNGIGFFSPVAGGFSFHGQSSAYLGDKYSTAKNRIRGRITVDLINLNKSIPLQNYIDQYLKTKNIQASHLISYTSVARVADQIELYIIYISDPEPQIITGYPHNHSLVPADKKPKQLTLTFSVDLDEYQVTSQTNLFAVTSGFGLVTEISPSDITLLSDRRTVVINMQSYITSNRVYTVIARPGIISSKRFIKQKPDFWTVVVDTYEGSSGSGDANMNDVMRRIAFRGMGA